jgi:hypothetical protein
MWSPELLIRVSFCTGVTIRDTKCWLRWCMFNTSWRILWQLLQKFKPLLEFGPHLSLCHLSLSLAHVDICFICWRWWKTTSGSSSKLSRLSCKRLCQSYAWEFFIALSLYAYCNIVEVCACDFCNKIQNLLFVRCYSTDIFNADATLCTLNKQLPL